MKKVTELDTKKAAATDDEVTRWKATHNPSDPMSHEIKAAILRQFAEKTARIDAVVDELRQAGVLNENI